MKKALILCVLVVLLGAWLIQRRAAVSNETKLAEVSAQTASPPVRPPPAAAVKPDSVAGAANPGPVLTSAVRSVTIASTAPAQSAPAQSAPAAPAVQSPAYPEMSLSDVLQPNNVFRDAVFGVSLSYPEGWSVNAAHRWGTGNSENTVFFNSPPGSQAVPSVYYQKYPDSQLQTGDPETMLRTMAQQKEASRQENGIVDYRNDPDSFVFRNIDGHPSLSYFATYSQGSEVRAEYFMRILGPTGYVMYFVRGPVKDVQAAIPDVFRMGTTTTPP